MMATYYPVFAALALVAYLALKARLNRIAQPLRLELADRGEALLADPHVPEGSRTFITFELGGVFGRTWLLLLGFLATPVLAIWCAVDSSEDATQRINNDASRGRVDEFVDMSMRIAFLNSPILMPALCAWLAAWFVPAVVISAALGRAVRLLNPNVMLAAVHARIH